MLLILNDYFVLFQVITALLAALSSSKDGASLLHKSDTFQNMFTIAHKLLDNTDNSRVVRVFLVLNLVRSLLTCVVHSLNVVYDFNELSRFLSRFSKIGYLVLLKRLLRLLLLEL